MVVVYKITEMAPILGEVGHEANTPLVGAWTLVGLRRVYAPSTINMTATQSPPGWLGGGGYPNRGIMAIRAGNRWLVRWGSQPVGLELSGRVINDQ